MIRQIIFLIFLIASPNFIGCLDSQYTNPYPSNNYPQYPNSYPNYPNNYPNSYPNSYPNNYPNNYPYYPPPQGYPPQGYRYPSNNNWNGDRDNNHRHDHDHDNHRYPQRDTNSQANRPVNIPQPQAPAAPQPNCPPGTQFTGSTCKITDSRLRRPGGDGNINPCPKGMWMSGGKCVGK